MSLPHGSGGGAGAPGASAGGGPSTFATALSPPLVLALASAFGPAVAGAHSTGSAPATAKLPKTGSAAKAARGARGGSGGGPAPELNEAQRDLQARGKDPYEKEVNRSRHKCRAAPENAPCTCHRDPHAMLERQRHAATVLDTPELLMAYAQSWGDSIPATRMKFMRILCGFDEEARAARKAAGRAVDDGAPFWVANKSFRGQGGSVGGAGTIVAKSKPPSWTG